MKLIKALRVFVEANGNLPDDEVVSLVTWEIADHIPNARMKLHMRDFRDLVAESGELPGDGDPKQPWDVK